MSPIKPSPDESAGPADEVRPAVAHSQGRTSVYLFAAGMALLALLLFTALNNRRQTLEAPKARADAADLARAGQGPPMLAVPQQFDPDAYLSNRAFALPEATRGDASASGRSDEEGYRIEQAPTRIFAQPGPIAYDPQPVIASAAEPARGPTGGPVLVVDMGTGSDSGPAAAAGGVGGQSAGGTSPALSGRVRSGRLANPSTTVPQGTSIPAVLETALDSTRPGQARALVSLDVRGFDGSRVLIPRGSRIYGEYQADMQTGQKRALIQWTRLLRPDGVVIAIGSPTADRLGRAGIGGKVNTHFFEKFMGAILQSSLDIGVAVASRSIGDGSVVLLPGGLGQAAPPTQDIRPTLTVKQGRSIAVLVARDLDFASVAAGR